jgi:(E)-4-hydroxy-3-methylbut-2-enyl-diphosphate synthase
VKADINSLSDPRFENTADDETVIFVLETENENSVKEQRRFILELIDRKILSPVIIRRNYQDIPGDLTLLHAATDFGALLIDGLGDGVMLSGSEDKNFENRVLFGTLQAVRARISKTEYIACPSCGRTLFDLVEVTNRIRKRTEHLKGVKIGIMGCIVNGPGEMADADFGYVGSGPGKITLYRGKEVVKKNLNSDLAVEELIRLIKDSGLWVEKD